MLAGSRHRSSLSHSLISMRLLLTDPEPLPLTFNSLVSSHMSLSLEQDRLPCSVLCVFPSKTVSYSMSSASPSPLPVPGLSPRPAVMQWGELRYRRNQNRDETLPTGPYQNLFPSSFQDNDLEVWGHSCAWSMLFHPVTSTSWCIFLARSLKHSIHPVAVIISLSSSAHVTLPRLCLSSTCLYSLFCLQLLRWYRLSLTCSTYPLKQNCFLHVTSTSHCCLCLVYSTKTC